MLVEPEMDPATAALDAALVAALAGRLAVPLVAGPDAEALALRAVLDRTTDLSQSAMVKALWGRISAVNGPRLAVCGATARELAADRFGLPLRVIAEPDAALVEAMNGARVVIDLDQPRPWWAKLLARPQLSIIAALPDDRYGRPRALTVSTEHPGPTGEDRTFWVTDSPLGVERVLDGLADVGFMAQGVATAGGLKLFTLQGYVQAEDGRLAAAPGDLKGVIGAAPVY